MRLKLASATCALLAFSCSCVAHSQQSSQSAQLAAGTQGSQAPNAQGPLRVTGDVMQAKLTHRVPPVYPQIARLAHVAGTVVVRATVSKDGAIQKLAFLSGPALLRQVAMAAVKQWKFEPTLLNGQPVEVETEIPVNFDDYDGPPRTFKIDVRETGSSRIVLTESIDAPRVANDEDWAQFISAFSNATCHPFFDAVPPSTNKKKGKVIVGFTLRRDGTLDSPVSVAHSSGDPAIDTAAQLAITKAAPFSGLPANLTRPVVELHVTFAYDHPHAAAPPGAAQ